jgi:hypothetical protein
MRSRVAELANVLFFTMARFKEKIKLNKVKFIKNTTSDILVNRPFYSETALLKIE